MEFQVKKKSWSGNFCSKGNPKIVGYLSMDKNGKCSEDLSQLKYYIPHDERADVYFDLNDGYDKAIKKKVIPSNNIDDLLHWVRMHPKLVKSCRPDFISMRGVIIQLFFTLIKKDDGWIICAAKFNDTIYLSAYQTDKRQKYESTRSEKQKCMDSWGYKFEQYILRDDPAKLADTSKPVDENEEFCCLFSNKIGNHRLLYAGEMDGVYSNKIVTEKTILNNKIKFVELKTSKQLLDKNNPNYNFKMKVAKAWCQSSLSCVEEVLFGFRDKDGILLELKRYSVNELIELMEPVFYPRVAMNFCNMFLNHVKNVVTEDTDKFIYKFSWDPKTQIHIKEEKLENTNNQSEFAFLPEWYTVDSISEKNYYNSDRKKLEEERNTIVIFLYLFTFIFFLHLCRFMQLFLKEKNWEQCT